MAEKLAQLYWPVNMQVLLWAPLRGGGGSREERLPGPPSTPPEPIRRRILPHRKSGQGELGRRLDRRGQRHAVGGLCGVEFRGWLNGRRQRDPIRHQGAGSELGGRWNWWGK